MTDRPALPPGLLEWLGRLAGCHPAQAPAEIVMGHDLYNNMITSRESGRFGGSVTHLLGLKVTIDPYIETGTWQVLAADRTLLRDSRSTNEVSL